LAVVFFIAAMSLAGIPPSSGFVSKLSLLEGAIAGQNWLISVVSLLVSLLTLMSMLRLWQKAFWGQPSQPIYPTAPLAQTRRRWFTLTPIAALVVLSLSIGLFSAQVFHWSEIAAHQVLDREGYIRAVSPTDDIQFLGNAHGE
jgi:multicomponent Na+:H+ antiporter subunit D